MASKFRQISVSSVPDDNDGVIDSVYALDEAGVVWLFNNTDERWEALSKQRYVAGASNDDAGEDEGE
jgi:Tfp pilus tip-associated adhesin PilY1